MSSDIAISVENLSKSYLVGHNSAKAERYTALRDVIANNARNLARKTRDMFDGKAIVQGDEVEEFWALKDVSFNIKQGDRVGIIGRNGAGKSTLLKILSRITEPTSGRVKINGRVASLLEVGTGFHPELTGRENIFLNGAILGMSRNEIQRKFDEIVAFAEVQRFLDTPVKRYSSGMYVRLAFAVAAHLEPEILIVDEVLAVGDAEFQKKCLGKMDEIGTEGRTVIFVSHNIAAINYLTKKCIYLINGEVVKFSETRDVVNDYQLNSFRARQNYRSSHKKNNINHIAEIIIETSENNLIHDSGSRFEVTAIVNFVSPSKKSCLSIHIINEFGVSVVHLHQHDIINSSFGSKTGNYLVKFSIPELRLNVGEYKLNCYLAEPPGGKIFEKLEDVCHFTVIKKNAITLYGWRADACTYFESYNIEIKECE